MEKKLIKYPVGQQSFEQLIRGGYLYVDKTEYVEKIVNGYQYYFLGRPRRFGKSLFLSTLKCFFQGKRELFKGLYIDGVDWDWEPYPVLHIDLNPQGYHDDNNLELLMENILQMEEKRYGIVSTSAEHSIRLSNLIRTMSEQSGRGVVILVDEYDKPLVNNIHDRKRFEMYRAKLASLYSNFKSSAEYIRLVFLTGVSRFGKLSVFSALNNIADISFNLDFSAVCGITEQELHEDFKEGISILAARYKRSYEEELVQLKRHYDGYHFSEESPDIYNPFSILQVISSRKYANYWISSGTPQLLAEQLRRNNTELEKLLSIRCQQGELEGLDIDNMTPASLFYQTGYLTIKDYDMEKDIFRLGLPNEEVKKGFFEYLLPWYSNLKESQVHIFILDFRQELEEGNVDGFMKRLESMFAGFGYDMKFDEERNVQNAFLILFSLLGMDVETEVRTSDGRIDILVRTAAYLYIMELKYDATAEEALAQIERKEYSLPWRREGRRIIEIGINYSSGKRRIDGWATNIN